MAEPVSSKRRTYNDIFDPWTNIKNPTRQHINTKLKWFSVSEHASVVVTKHNKHILLMDLLITRGLISDDNDDPAPYVRIAEDLDWFSLYAVCVKYPKITVEQFKEIFNHIEMYDEHDVECLYNGKSLVYDIPANAIILFARYK